MIGGDEINAMKKTQKQTLERHILICFAGIKKLEWDLKFIKHIQIFERIRNKMHKLSSFFAINDFDT